MSPISMSPINTIRKLFPVVLLLFTLAACGGSSDDMPADRDERAGMDQQSMHDEALPRQDMTGEGTATSRMEDGVQVVEIEAGADGYEPGRVELRAGVPARLIFTRTSPSACLQQVQIPAFDVEATDLPMHEAVAIEFTPEESGAFQFVCGMNMQHGTMVVTS